MKVLDFYLEGVVAASILSFGEGEEDAVVVEVGFCLAKALKVWLWDMNCFYFRGGFREAGLVRRTKFLLPHISLDCVGVGRGEDCYAQ